MGAGRLLSLRSSGASLRRLVRARRVVPLQGRWRSRCTETFRDRSGLTPRPRDPYRLPLAGGAAFDLRVAHPLSAAADKGWGLSVLRIAPTQSRRLALSPLPSSRNSTNCSTAIPWDDSLDSASPDSCACIRVFRFSSCDSTH